MMDEEEDDMPEPDMNPAVRTFALTATAEFLLFIGVVFIMLGVASFLTDYLKIKGSGEALVGIVMVVIAVALLVRMRPDAPIRIIQRPPEEQNPKESGDYR